MHIKEQENQKSDFASPCFLVKVWRFFKWLIQWHYQYLRKSTRWFLFEKCTCSPNFVNVVPRQAEIWLIICHQHLRMIALRLFTKRYICCPSFVTIPPLEKEMCLIVKVTGLRSCNVTVSCGRVVLWRIPL